MWLPRLALFVLFALALCLPQSAFAQSWPPSMYSTDSVWDWSSHANELLPLCGASSWFDLRPDTSVADQGCIESAMRQLGASESAVQFFDTTSQFLLSVDKRGAIDFGRASSPWVNMGRGEAVLLNAAPSAILMSRAVNPTDDSWKSMSGYASLLQRNPNASPWTEYGGPVTEVQSDDGGVTIDVGFDMRECRACPNLATFREELVFNPAGFIIATNVLPPAPARI
jgi:hypothetical protein